MLSVTCHIQLNLNDKHTHTNEHNITDSFSVLRVTPSEKNHLIDRLVQRYTCDTTHVHIPLQITRIVQSQTLLLKSKYCYTLSATHFSTTTNVSCSRFGS